MVARLIWVQEAERSNRSTRTKKPLKSVISEVFSFHCLLRRNLLYSISDFGVGFSLLKLKLKKLSCDFCLNVRHHCRPAPFFAITNMMSYYTDSYFCASLHFIAIENHRPGYRLLDAQGGVSFYFSFFPHLPFLPSGGSPFPSPKSFSRCASAISAFISTMSTFSFSSHSSRVWA